MVNEKRMIYADSLDEKCRRQMADEWNKRVAPVSWAEAYKEFLDDIWDAPTVDAVEVVRCKDCKHLEITGCYGECRKLVRIVKPWDFCSYGERKDAER